MAMISRIDVHHFAGNLTLPQLNAYHKSRWPDFPSRLNPNWFVGYQICIWRDGSWTQTRYFGEEGAHTKGHNWDTIGIALNGNCNKEKPTLVQTETLRRILTSIIKKDFAEFKVLTGTEINVPLQNIVPHRALSQTDCYGTLLSDTWARNLVPDEAEIKPLP